MEESTTYQYIIEQGELKGARKMLLMLGKIRFGAPTRKVRAAIQGSEDLPKLRRMSIRLLSANSWDELLATP